MMSTEISFGRKPRQKRLNLLYSPVMKKFSLALLLLAVLSGIAIFAMPKLGIADYVETHLELQEYEKSRESIPETTKKPAVLGASQAVSEAIAEIPNSINYDLPFIPQAPFANWDERHEDFCEEASLVMAAYYTETKQYTDLEAADELMNNLADWELTQFGSFKSTNNAETTEIGSIQLGLNIDIEKVDIKQIKQFLAEGRVIIAPTAGRELGNPFFQTPGPVYHMLLIKGYTENGQFVTNDPGTKHGADFLYDEQTLYDAIGEYQYIDGSVNTTIKEVLVVN